VVDSGASTCHFYEFTHYFLSPVAIMDNKVFSGSLVFYAIDVMDEYFKGKFPN